MEGEKRQCCFNEFPHQCEGCPEYSKTRHDPTLQLVLQAAAGGIPFPPQYTKRVTKECKLHHKRTVEYS